MASFVENVNKVSLNLDTIVKANYMFDDSVLPVLQEVADLDLQEVTSDLRKGNYLGNRKIDIDLSLNKLTSASLVSYSKADITLVSGVLISIPFLSGASVLELTSHNDIRNYIVNDALWAGVQYTECTVEESTTTAPTMIRFRDADGHSSNIERVELYVYGGTAKDIKPVYFWAQTTSALQTIANRVGDIIALGNNMNNVIELSQRIDELNELQAELTSLLAIHANLAEILLADTNAGIATTKAAEALASKTSALQALSDATAQAVIATNQAVIATTKSNEIKSITTQTTTGAAGSLAQVSYNSTDGKLSFVIPQGFKGDRGEAFSVNAMGTFAQRTGYDAQPINFSYFATDMSLIYFKQSATSADWSVGIPFGKGDTGDTGLTGNGISTISKISGTGAAGSADTYRITYTSGGTFDFTVWNGTESVISVAGKRGTVVLAKADVGLGNVDNTTDLSKPISTATTNALALKADDSTVVHKTGNETIAGVKTFSSSIVGNITGNAGTATTATNQSGGSVNATTGRFNNDVIASQSITIGTGGTFSAGSIYSDSSWGMIFRAKQLSPATAQFMWANSEGGELFRFNGTALTTNITGNSITSTALVGDETNWASYRSRSVANMLGWKNYGNGHCIFDASAGTSPPGSAVNNTNSTSPWVPTHPTLMGWNGGQTFGVRVDSARVADSTTYASAFTTAVGSAPSYACRAWVNFNGTGTVAIMASGNVSSITDNGVGDYTVNFTTAMSDANYSWNGTVRFNTYAGVISGNAGTYTKTTTALRVSCVTLSGASQPVGDPPDINISIVR